MLSTDKAWRRWGKHDPYYGVLAHDRFARGEIDANRDEFFATGRGFVTDILRRTEAHFGKLERGRALDHGCGVGRLTLPLARQFASVTALDVSPDMLAEADANARRANLANIDFLLSDDTLSRATGAFDFVNSHMVLQHVPVRRGLTMLFAMVDKVAPGGGFHLHLCCRTDRGPPRWLYWASANIPGVKIWQNICARRGWNAPAMQMNDYPLARILRDLERRGIADVLVLTEQHDRFITCSLIGRTPASA